MKHTKKASAKVPPTKGFNTAINTTIGPEVLQRKLKTPPSKAYPHRSAGS